MIKRKPQRSLRTILVVWFILFSVIPLAFVTGYSVIKYEKAIDNELSVRLSGNAREISVIFGDFASGLAAKARRYIKDPTLIYNASVSDSSALRSLTSNWLRSDFASSLTVFNREGKMLVSVFKDDKGEVKQFQTMPNAEIFLSDGNLQKIKTQERYSLVEYGKDKKISLIAFSKITNKSGRIVGFLEQLIDIDQDFLERLKQRMKLELILVRGNGQVLVGTHEDFYRYPQEILADVLKDDRKTFFDYSIRGVPFGFITYPINWGESEFFLSLGASKSEAKAVLRNVNYAFYSVVGAVILVLIITILIASNTILKPLSELVEAIQGVQTSDRPFEIPVKSDTEIGLLTESFNSMARNIIQARSDLKRKITELESINDELKDTQAKLVHSSKMVSLGQLVAGVAHELNNPIGFIYSNMGHLDEYSQKLLRYSDSADQEPQKLSALKAELDIDYIRTDLPKLIASCKEGARRTRDIVLGLRNFSRLDEAKLKEIDLHEAIDQTLNLLAGEIKNRVQIHKEYGQVPLVTCYASQINQVFMNILSNALQAIEGSGNIWISTKSAKKTDGSEWAVVSFQDSGAGMPAEVLEKIFDPFFSTKPVGQGTGLGLSISYGIIQAHGGEIVAKSQVGIGTEFLVRIPTKAQL
jgi:two-component system NtrC family sensor kinase